MAMSKPVPSAQLGFITKCDLCDSLEDVNSFCKNCLQNLCDNCKKLHQKIPSLLSHDIGSIGDGRRFHKSEDLLCSYHGEILTHCCKTCSMNVCPKCLSNHLKHDLLNIDEEGQKMKEELEKTFESKAKLLEEVRESRDRMLQYKTKFDSIDEDVISKIDGEFDMIMKLKMELKDAVIGKNAKGREKIQKQIHISQNFESKLEGEMRRVKEDLPLYSGSSLITFIQTELEKLSAIETPPFDTTQSTNALEISSEPLSKFVESAKQFADIMRYARNYILTNEIFSEALVILSSFHLKSDILDILYDKEDKIWVTCSGARELKKVDRKGNIHQRIETVPNAVFLAKGQNGNVFVTSCYAEPIETNIRKFDSEGYVYQFARLAEFDVLYSLGLDNLGYLICHAGESGKHFMLKIDVNGEMLWKTDIGKQTSHASSITFSPQMLYYISLGTGICVIGSDGKILRRKDWDSKLGTVGLILFDNNGFLLAGTNIGAVHILCENFDVLKTYTPNNFKDSAIRALAVDSDNNLWIGNNKGLICVMKYTCQ